MVNWGDTSTPREREIAYERARKRKHDEMVAADKKRIEDEKKNAIQPYIPPYEDDGTDGDDDMHDIDTQSPVVAAPAPSAGGLVRAGAGIRPGRTDGSETGIDRIGEVKLRPFHDTQDVIMPYTSRDANLVQLAASDGPTGQGSFAIRINSIYDVLSSAAYSENPAAAADTVDATINKPMMFDYWMSIYTYWTVTKATYKVTFWTKTKSDDGELSIWCYHNGLQQPPLTDANSKVVPDYIRHMHKHNHVKRLRTMPSGSIAKHAFDNSVTFTGTYLPGNKTVVNDVSEDEYKETWHKSTEAPSQREVATFIANQSDRASSVAIDLYYYIEVIYHVQLKDLKRQWQYGINTDDFPATADYMSMTN